VDAPVFVPPGVAVRQGRLITAIGGRLAGMRRPAAAVTLGRVILVHQEVRVTARLLRHELAHVRQWAARPLAFPLLYTWNHLRFGYRNNPYEVEARAAEEEESSS
jgi:hypothetical protein